MVLSSRLSRIGLAAALVVVAAACQRDADDFIVYKPGVYQGQQDDLSLTDEERSQLRTHAKRQGG